MDELIQAMSIPELQHFKEQYAGNESIIKIVDGYIVVKEQEIAKAKAKDEFGKVIAKMVAKLPHPDDVLNVHLRWAEVEVEDTSQEPEEVEVEGVKELRYPKIKMFQWVVELNKGFQVSKTSSGGNQVSGTSKRAITVKRIEGESLVPVGNFHSANEACKHLRLIIGGDSANRVLQRDGYLSQACDGTDYTEVS